MARTILLSGPIGSGKSTILALGARALHPHWGSTAVIDTDVLVMMVDPRWELSDEERRYDLTGWQVWLLAHSFLSSGFDTVVIGGNGLHRPDEGPDELVELLLGVSDVHHVTLDPSDEVIRQRLLQRGATHLPADLADHLTSMRASYGDWTCRIDNSRLSPLETVEEITARIATGEGRLTGPIGPR